MGFSVAARQSQRLGGGSAPARHQSNAEHRVVGESQVNTCLQLEHVSALLASANSDVTVSVRLVA